MTFAGKVWRLLVGIKDALALLFLLLFFVGLYMVLTARPSPGQVRELRTSVICPLSLTGMNWSLCHSCKRNIVGENRSATFWAWT